MPGMSNARLLLLLACTIAVPKVFAQTLPPSVIACADETDVLKRLSCYDREVARYRTPGTAATAPGGPTASVAPSAAAATASIAPTKASVPPASSANASAAAADFGMNGELKRQQSGGQPSEPAKLDKLTARLASVSSRPTGEAIYSLEGGQIWVEAETGAHIPLHAGEEVTIKRGVLGAFYLSSAEVRGLRVKRVR